MAKDFLIGKGKKRPLDPASRERKKKQKREKIKNKGKNKSNKAAIYRAKDPKEMLQELYNLDEQEYIQSMNPSGHANILKEKRRKLKDSFEKYLLFMQRDDKEKYLEIKKMQFEFDIKRRNIQKNVFLANKQKELDSIAAHPLKHILPNIPLPNECIKTSKFTLPTNDKTTSTHKKYIPLIPSNIYPPGPPPCQPPPTAIPIPEESYYSAPSQYDASIPHFHDNSYLYDFLPPPPPPPKKNFQVVNKDVDKIYQENIFQNESKKDLEHQNKIYYPIVETPAVISADPKLRDMQAEVTKLIPISVLKKREEKIPQTTIGRLNFKSDHPVERKEESSADFLKFIDEVNKM